MTATEHSSTRHRFPGGAVATIGWVANDTAELRICGELDTQDTASLSCTLGGMLRAGARRILVNAHSLDFVDRRVLAEFDRVRRELWRSGGGLHMYGLVPPFSLLWDEVCLAA